ncbi:Fc.00g070550.m01.CDS01 [Cosmosporella sp. VM-42]
MSSSGQGTLDGWVSRRPAPRPAQMASSSEPPRSPSDPPISGLPTASSSQPEASSSSKSRKEHKDAWRRGSPLAAVAKETRKVLPDILAKLPNIHASVSEVLFEDRYPCLKASECPKRTPSRKTKIMIVNDDSFNAAIDLAALRPKGGRVAVMNMASHVSPGGGWLKGSRAQEEALCYRSSLYLSLHKRAYPWKMCQAMYTPDVVIIRSDQDSGNKLLMDDPKVKAEDLPVVSVLSVAAICRPPVDKIKVSTGNGLVDREVFARPSDRELTKAKMRLCLRMAARHNHGLLVLGALGCGAFKNPPKEVAHCWLEVFREDEFRGGWWEEVWFAVFDKRNEGNFEVFEETLGGVEI